jgi:hypothetical protein
MVQALVRFQCLLLKILAKAGIQIQINISIKHLKTKKMKNQANKHYTHFAVIKGTNVIVNGWDYRCTEDDDHKEYEKMDIEDLGYYYKDVKVLSAKHLIRNNVNPYDYKNWIFEQENKEKLLNKYLKF